MLLQSGLVDVWIPYLLAIAIVLALAMLYNISRNVRAIRTNLEHQSGRTESNTNSSE